MLNFEQTLQSFSPNKILTILLEFSISEKNHLNPYPLITTQSNDIYSHFTESFKLFPSHCIYLHCLLSLFGHCDMEYT
jgi:hypothetical protein